MFGERQRGEGRQGGEGGGTGERKSMCACVKERARESER